VAGPHVLVDDPGEGLAGPDRAVGTLQVGVLDEGDGRVRRAERDPVLRDAAQEGLRLRRRGDLAGDVRNGVGALESPRLPSTLAATMSAASSAAPPMTAPTSSFVGLGDG
jgi:hypothetical protein